MELTPRQKAILNWAAVNDVDDWQTIYRLASDKSYKYYEGKNITQQASTWKRSAKVQAFYQLQRANALRLRKAAEILEKEDAKDKETKQARETEQGQNDTAKKPTKEQCNKNVNYLDRSELMQALNRAANDITDIKQRTDVLKLIADLSRMRDNDKGNDQIRRFYLPLSCQNCALYAHAREIRAAKDDTEQE